MKKTEYFRTKRPAKHPEVTCRQCLEIVEAPLKREVERNGRIRLWGRSEESGRVIRVILEPDGETLHNAFINGTAERRLNDVEE